MIKSNRLRRIEIASTAALTLAMLAWPSSHLRADTAATQPSAPPAQSVDALTGDLGSQYTSIQDFLDSPGNLTDPKKRAEIAPKIIPNMRKMVSDFTQLLPIDPDHKQENLDGRAEFTMFLALFGDSAAADMLASNSKSSDPAIALEGKRSQLMITWINASSDPATQSGLADQIEKLAKQNPTDVALTMQLLRMGQLGCSTPDLQKRLEAVVTDDMKNDVADASRQQLQADQKLSVLNNKPLTIAGKQVDGKPFISDNWKGKVVLVDFWATWCPPCRAEMPDIIKAYSEYHDKGLEVLGVSNDYAADDVSKFISESKMPWPQLLDVDAAKAQQWNPVTLSIGIESLPTMLIIDKKGICRSVNGSDEMEELIPKLLAEK